MDGVLCDDEPSRMAGIDLFPEIGAEVTAEHLHLLLELTNILGGVAPLKGVEGFDTEVAKKRLKYISKRIVIEDSLAGVQAAKAAQMRLDTYFVLVLKKQAGRALIKKEIPNISIQDILGGGGVSSCDSGFACRLLEVQMMSEPDAENADATFQILSQRLKQIWDEVGASYAELDQTSSEIDKGCWDSYKKIVDQAQSRQHALSGL
ncbi:hypothetical protein C5167_007152 [Papaver somniferum]|uniref:Uncharacterized protein n=1 Tax=Papaver somniferum TaxID=3469 RepID=A0A4Y7JFE0_PAPSO|nr:hypothetical protein C5167_007152 [Papaver somniferum]